MTVNEDIDTVIEANDKLAEALNHANTHMKADEIRPSAMMAFDAVQEAHLKLNEIDPTRNSEKD